MEFRSHATLTLDALKRWFIAQLYDCLIVAAMWLALLLWLHVPLAVFWALFGGLLQIIPGIGLVIALIGPALSLLLAGAPWKSHVELLIGFAVLAVIEGLLVQPFLLHRKNGVPFWASILVPVVMGVIIPFWGVLLAPPLLAVIWAYRGWKPQPEPIRAGQGIVLPPERASESAREAGNEPRRE